jgi:hypothetical protein
MHRLLFGTAFVFAVITSPARAADEDDVKAAFAAFQTALKSGDADKIWPLLDAATQANADKVAAVHRTAYGKLGAADKAKLEKQYKLTAAEMAGLTGKIYVKSHRFLGKYDEIPTSKFDKATVDGDKAIVNYTEADGDKVKLDLIRKDGKWLVNIRIPE